MPAPRRIPHRQSHEQMPVVKTPGLYAKNQTTMARRERREVIDADTITTTALAPRGVSPMRRPIGGRRRENMTLSEEKALLARFGKAAGAGEMLNVHDLKAAYEQAIGQPTSNSTIYNLLARHGWRKLMPRPFHPRRDLAAQDDFKKAASHAP